VRRRAAVVLAALALIAAACSDDDAGDAQAADTEAAATDTEAAEASAPEAASPDQPAEPDEPAAPFEVTTTQLTLVDESRTTPASPETEELPNRTLDVWVRTPADDDPVPLVIFSHGLTGHPRSHTELLDAWASSGLVVAAPAYPRSNQDAPAAFTGAADIEGQVGDVSFLIDELLAHPEIGPRIDPESIGAAGHSLGGLTTAGVTLGEAADDRIDAAVVISAGFIAEEDRADLPTMLIHGDDDQIVPVDFSITAQQTLTGPSWLVVLPGGDHIEGILDDDSEFGPVVTDTAQALWDSVLRGADPSVVDPSIVDEVIAAAVDEGLVDPAYVGG